MKLLLDTHIFLWLIDDDKRLSEQYRQAILSWRQEVSKIVSTLYGINLELSSLWN